MSTQPPSPTPASYSRRPRLCLFSAGLLFLLACSLTAWLASRPWFIDVPVGQQDSALIAGGLSLKERSSEGVRFRWTTGTAVFQLPWVRPQFLLRFRADTGTGQPYQVSLLSRRNQITTVGIQPGFRTYHVLWQPDPFAIWADGAGVAELRISAPARQLNPSDKRLLGVALSQLQVREVRTAGFSWAPLLVVGLVLAGLMALIKPTTPRRLGAFGVAAIGLPILFDLLIWHPPTNDLTLLPLPQLAWAGVLLILGSALSAAALHKRNWMLISLGLITLTFVALALTLRSQWTVEGPDFNWHLNRGGSWDRVLRAHGYYPFGFPMILFLGQQAGGEPMALAYGQTAGLIGSSISLIATSLLAWRISGQLAGVATALLLLCSPLFVGFGVVASTDALMVAPLMVGLLCLGWQQHSTPQLTFAAGLAFGLAYLFRHQVLFALPAVMLWLVIRQFKQPGNGWRKPWLMLPGLMLLGFLLGSAPQWILDIRDIGRPFHSTQYTNIGLFAFDMRDYDGDRAERLGYILSYDPHALWRHWVGNLRTAGEQMLLWVFSWPAGLLALGGVWLALLHERDRRPVLILLIAISISAAVALALPKDRFLLPTIPLLALLGSLPLAHAEARLAAAGWRWLSPWLLALLWLLSYSQLYAAELVLSGYGFPK